jgi:hypothetical protein
MNEAHEWQDAVVARMEDPLETPPPPYNLEDNNPYSTSILHNPELAELDSGIPYQVRGSISSPIHCLSLLEDWH